MILQLRRRAPGARRKARARPDAEQTIRAFLRTLARLAPRASGSGALAAQAVREKP